MKSKLLATENTILHDDYGRLGALTSEMKEAESPAFSEEAEEDDEEEELQILMEEARREVSADLPRQEDPPLRPDGPPAIPWTPHVNDVTKSTHHVPEVLSQSARTAKFRLSSAGMMDFVKYLLVHPSSDPLTVALSAEVMTAYTTERNRYELSVSRLAKRTRTTTQSEGDPTFPTALREILNGLVKAHRATFCSHMPPQWTPFHTDAIRNSQQMAEWQRRYGGIAHFAPGVAPEVEVVTLDEDHSSEFISHLRALQPRLVQWDLPTTLYPSHDTLHKLQREHACHLLAGPPVSGDGNVTIRSYGFGVQLDEVLTELLTASPPTTPTPDSSVDREYLTEEHRLFDLHDSADRTPETGENEEEEVGSYEGVTCSNKTVAELVHAERDLLRQALSPIGLISSVVGFSKRYAHSMQFTFADREAGIFYQAFEPDFNLSFSRAFGVSITQVEGLSGGVGDDTASLSTRRAASGSGGGGERNRALKVTVSGPELRNVQTCISKLNQCLNASTLRREMVYFPHCSTDFYLKLSGLKESQDERLLRHRRAERLKSRASGDVPLDPMMNGGFVNIRIKPPMHNKGLTRMSLPADSTVTICGPHATQEQREQFQSTLREWEELPSPYPCGTMQLMSCNPYCKQVTVKTSREGYCRKMGLVGLKVNESVVKKAGVAGLVKMWAKDQASLSKALSMLEEAQIDCDPNGSGPARSSASMSGEMTEGGKEGAPPRLRDREREGELEKILSAVHLPGHKAASTPAPPSNSGTSHQQQPANSRNQGGRPEYSADEEYDAAFPPPVGSLCPRIRADTSDTANSTLTMSSGGGLSPTSRSPGGPRGGSTLLSQAGVLRRTGSTTLGSREQEVLCGDFPPLPAATSPPGHTASLSSPSKGLDALLGLLPPSPFPLGGTVEGAVWRRGASEQQLIQPKNTLPLHELHWADVKQRAAERLHEATMRHGGSGGSSGSGGVRRVMHWPESSLRFVLLEHSLKTYLQSITTIFKSAGVTVTTPYRAKKDPDSCMLLDEGPTLALAAAVARQWREEHSLDWVKGSGSSGATYRPSPYTVRSAKDMDTAGPPSSLSASSSGLVEMAAGYVDDFFCFVAERLITVRLSLSSNVHDSLVARELALLKELQGRHGVHIHLGEDSGAATSTIITGSGSVRSNVPAKGEVVMKGGVDVHISLARTLLPPYTASAQAAAGEGTPDTSRAYARESQPRDKNEASLSVLPGTTSVAYPARLSEPSVSELGQRNRIPGGALVSVSMHPTSSPLRTVTITAYLERAWENQGGEGVMRPCSPSISTSAALEDGEVDETTGGRGATRPSSALGQTTILGDDLDAYCVLLDDDADLWLPEADRHTLDAGGVLVVCAADERRPRMMLRARPSSDSAVFTTGEELGRDSVSVSLMSPGDNGGHTLEGDQAHTIAKQKRALGQCFHQVMLKATEMGARTVALFLPTYNLNVSLLSYSDIQSVAVQVSVKVASRPEGRQLQISEITLCLDEAATGGMLPSEGALFSSPAPPTTDALAMELAYCVAQVASFAHPAGSHMDYHADLVERGIRLSLLAGPSPPSPPSVGDSELEARNQESKSDDNRPCSAFSAYKGHETPFFSHGMDKSASLFAHGALGNREETKDELPRLSWAAEEEDYEATITEDPSEQEERLMSLLRTCKHFADKEYARVTMLVEKQQEAVEVLKCKEDCTSPAAVTLRALSRLGLRALSAAEMRRDIPPPLKTSSSADDGGFGSPTALSVIGVKKKNAPTRSSFMSPLAAAAAEPERSHFMIRGLPARVANCINELRCLVLAPSL